MDRRQIRLRKTDSVNSVNSDNFLGVELKTTFKKLHYNDIKATIDQYERFITERAECENYRVILTINPYCTNVLFNPLTEIVKDDWSERYWNNDATISGIYGFQTPKRIQMISNTEYSKPEKNGDDKSGYIYFPGYDIFDNHILRGTSFNVVERGLDYGEIFNTLADYERDSSGEVTKMYKRKNIDTKPTKILKHLHTTDEFLSFDESVNANLTDENGWFGFINASNIKTTSPGDDGTLSDFSCVINNRKNCEFIEMYPDSTLYSFVPQYNSNQHRLERNWEVFLTYAFENDYCNELVKNNSLPILSVNKKLGLSGEDIIVFRCYTKHNLSRGDMFKLIYTASDTPNEVICRVANRGDASSGDEEYYFYVNASEFNIDLNEMSDVRIRKITNGIESRYYVRKMKRIDCGDDCYYDEKTESYRLAFADTIYGDDTAQFTFTDTINIKDKRDNLGRPLSEIFVTIVKTNYGNKEWYSNSTDISDVECSHCFGDITRGYVLSHEKYDKFSNEIMLERERMHDVRLLNNNKRFKSLIKPIVVSGKDIEFDGDVVEFSPDDCMEHVLAECAFRFNSYQREHPSADFIYNEIEYDDYDVKDFKITKNTAENKPRDEGYYYKAHYPIKIRGFGGINQMGHNDIKIIDVKPVMSENVEISVRSSLPSRLNENGIVYMCDDKNNLTFEFVCTKVESSVKFNMIPNHPSDVYELKGDTSQMINFDEYKMLDDDEKLLYTQDPWAYLRNKLSDAYEDGGNYNWVNLTKMMKEEKLRLRAKNDDIPDYAVKSGKNTYMWRNVAVYGDITDDYVPEYTFTNNSFYLTPIIRFYLKRQDPDDSVGLYAKEDFPNDVYGNIAKVSNYYYKEEINNGC